MGLAQRLLLLTAIVGGLTQAAVAQSESDPRASELFMLGIVRSAESDRPVAGARLQFSPAEDRVASRWSLPSANEPIRQDDPRGPFPTFRGSTDARGAFRISVEQKPGSPRLPTTGWLGVEVEGGLIALAERCTIGSPQPIRVVKPAIVEVLGGRQDWIWRIQAVAELTRSLRIPDRTSSSIVLPPGRYRILLEDPKSGARRLVTRRFASGETHRIRPATRTECPRIAPDTDERGTWLLPDWHGVDLATDDSDNILLPSFAGRVRLQFLAHRERERATAWFQFEYDGRRHGDPIRLTIPAIEMRTVRFLDASNDQPTGRLEVREFRPGVDGQPDLWFASSSVPDGSAHLISAPPESSTVSTTRLRITRNGFAPAFVDPPPPNTTSVRVDWLPCRSLAVRVTLPDHPVFGTPAIIRLDALAEGLDSPLFAVTNRRGAVYFDQLVPGEVILSVEHPDHLRAQVRVDLRHSDRVHIALESGRVLRGIVRRPDGSPAAGAILELRDASGDTAVATRIAAADADGSFEFGGLFDSLLTLFAQFERDGQTWSARMSEVRPGELVEIRLDDEDPPLPGSRRPAGARADRH